MVTPSVPLGPFSYTAPGDLGTPRDTMLCNELLLRDKLGRPKSRGFYLPGKGFTYGCKYDRRDETVAEAMRGWGFGSKLPSQRPQKPTERDFMALNRSALSAGLVTAKELYDYRTSHDIRRKSSAEHKKYRGMRLPPGMVFGMPARPSTPIYEILEHKYQDRWIRDRLNVELAKREKQKQKKSQLFLYDTRASLLRTYQNPVEARPLWKMPRFAETAKPHLATFRSSQAKGKAWENFELDSVSRKGMLGQGVYEGAKN